MTTVAKTAGLTCPDALPAAGYRGSVPELWSCLRVGIQAILMRRLP